MEKYILIILIFISSVCYGQGYSNLGNTNANDTARIMYNWLLPMKGIRMPFYSNTDSNFLLIQPNSGIGVRYSLTQLISRIGTAIGFPTLQEVITNGNDLDVPNNIVFGSNPLTFTGQRFNFVTDTLYSDGLIEYTDNRRNEYKPRTLPDWENVKDTLSEAIFSTNWQAVMTRGNTTTTSAHINHGSEALGLHASSIADHVYMSFYPDQSDPDDRHAYFGYPANGVTNIELTAEKAGARIKFITNAGGVDINGGSAFYGDIPAVLTNSTIPAWKNVKDSISGYATNSSFDTTILTTTNSLTDNRFTRLVSIVSYGGMAWNSYYFTQNTTTGTITGINGLLFYEDKKYTFNLK